LAKRSKIYRKLKQQTVLTVFAFPETRGVYTSPKSTFFDLITGVIHGIFERIFLKIRGIVWVGVI